MGQGGEVADDGRGDLRAPDQGHRDGRAAAGYLVPSRHSKEVAMAKRAEWGDRARPWEQRGSYSPPSDPPHPEDRAAARRPAPVLGVLVQLPAGPEFGMEMRQPQAYGRYDTRRSAFCALNEGLTLPGCS
jgi:hypothetical protein